MNRLIVSANVTFAIILCFANNLFAAEADPGPGALVRITDQETLRSKVAEYRGLFQRDNQKAEPGAFIRDKATYHKRQDLHLAIEDALNRRQPIDLTKLGFTLTESGDYSIKTRNAPEWGQFDSFLRVLASPDAFEGNAKGLKRRGFRDADLQLLQSYLEAHRPEHVSFFQNKALTEKFATTIQSRNRVVSSDEISAFVYQANRNINEARRQWAVGLLDMLDKQRQRILISYFQEIDATYVIAAANAGNPGAEARERQVVDYLSSSQYRLDLERKESEIRREMQR